MPGLDIDALLAEREWVGRVARTLAHGDAEAEDLEQRAWVRALEHPPAEAPRSPRGWLRTVLRFASIDGLRERQARRRHEAAAARPDRADADPGDLVARAEILERLVHAVLALEEPYRESILLRYFEDLPPRAIAARQGVPVETVRTRIKRALARLRRDLGGDRSREGLLLALAPLLRPEGNAVAAGAAGGIAMGTAMKLGLAAGAAVLLAGGVAAWRASSTPAEAPPRPLPVAAEPPSPRPAPVEAAPAPAAPPAAAKTEEPEKAAEPAPEVPSLEERLAECPEELRFDNATVGTALADLAARLRLEPEYESELLRQACFDTPFQVRFRTIPIRDVLSMAVRQVKSPVEGKAVLWRVRANRLLVVLGEPAPPPKPSEEEVKKRGEKESALLERIRTEKTSFSFDGQNLPEACAYLSARHGINIVTDQGIHERAKNLLVKLTLREVPLAEGFDELLRCDPELAWEVRGNLVLIRRK